MRVSVTDVGGVELAVREWGDPQGSPLFFVHALGPASSAALLDLSVGPLVEAGFRVVAPDLPGYGGSPVLPSDRYPLPRMAALMWALIDQLELGQVVLGGHSWGGAIAVHAAAQRPDDVRALVLLDSGHLDYDASIGAPVDATLDELIAQSESGRLRARDRADVASQLEVDVDDPLIDLILEAVTDDGEGGLVTRTPGAARGSAMYHLMRGSPTSTWPAIAAAGYPVLLLLATVPDETRAQNEPAAARFGSAIPHADVRLLTGVAHSINTDLREELGTMLVAWLGDHQR